MAKDKSLLEIFNDSLKEDGWNKDTLLESKGFFPTGNLGLDFILGGGLPRGRSAEFSGVSMSGKTTMAAMIAAQVQKMGLNVVYLDFEQALDKQYLQALGVNTERRFYPFPVGSLEEGSKIASEVVRTGEAALTVFDSVPAMVPRSSADNDDDPSRTVAMERARLLGGLLSRLNPLLANTASSAIFINHLQTEIPMGWSPSPVRRMVTPGGTALKYYSSVRVEFKILEKLKSERIDPLTGEASKDPHSVITQAEVTKNKVAPPFQKAKIYLELGKGFNNAYSAISALVGNDVVTKSGAFFRFPDDLYHPSMKVTEKGNTVQGLDNILAIAEAFPEWGQQLVTRAVASLPRERVVLSVPSLDKPVEDESAAEETVPRASVTAPLRSGPPRPQPGSSPVKLPGSGQTVRFTS